MLSKKLAELLQHARKQLGLSREELARRAQVSTRLVAELERGERPNVSLESALKLLSLVGVSINAKGPDGASAHIRNGDSISSERAARAALRRRTWTGAQVQLREAGVPPGGGRSHAERLSALSQLSKRAFALAAAGAQNRKRSLG
jgi:transcriptional regulator with XRE-family HTH domain